MNNKERLKWVAIRIPELIGSVALFFTITISVVNAICRYCLGFTIGGADEYIAIMFAWLVFSAGAAAYRRGMHYGIDLAVNMLPGKVRQAVAVVVRLITVVLLVALTYLSYVLFANVGPKILTATRISYRWLDASMIYGFGMMVIYSVMFLIRDIKALFGKAEAKEASI